MTVYKKIEDIEMKKIRYFIILLFSVAGCNVQADTSWVGAYFCLSNGQDVEITNTHLYIGEAAFKLEPKSKGNIFTYQEDVAVILPFEGRGNSFIQINLWNLREMLYNAESKTNKYDPKFILACERRGG